MTHPNTQSAMRSSDSRAAGLSVLSRIGSSLIALLIVLVLTRLLTRADFGRFALLYGAYEVLELLCALGLPASLLYIVALEGRKRARGILTGSAVVLTGVGIAIGGLLAALGGPLSVAVGDPVFHRLFVMLGAYIALGLPGTLIPNYLIATDRAGWALGYTVTNQLVRFAAVVVPAALGMPIETVIFFLMLSGTIPTLTLWGLIAAIDRGDAVEVRRTTLRQQLSYGLPFAASQGVSTGNRWIDKYTVGILMPMQSVGVFSACSQELPVVRNVPHGATTALIPPLTRAQAAGDVDDFIAIWHALMRKVALIVFPAFVFAFVTAPELITVMFTDAYADGAGVFRLYLLLLPLRLCIYGGILRALGDTASYLKAIVLTTVTNLALNYPLFLLLGWYGPALASVIAQTLMIVLLLRATAKRLEIRWVKSFPWHPLLRMAAVAVVGAPPLWLVLQQDLGAGLSVVIGGGVYLGCTVLVGLATKTVLPDDFRYLTTLFRK